MPSHQWIVLKFGGTSVSKLERWEVIYKVCQNHLKEKSRIIIVCSALSGISNKLQVLINLSLKGDFHNTLDSIIKLHLDFAHKLQIKDPQILLKEEFQELHNLALGLSLVKVSNPQLCARVMVLGELMLTKIAHKWLSYQGMDIKFLDSRTILTTISEKTSQNETQSYLSGTCQSGFDPKFAKEMEQHKESCFVTQGFIASNQNSESVLLGRGGSDVSAALIASKLKAHKIEIWSDVPGLFTTNPRQLATARLIRKLDYIEAQELSFCGAKVLHPKCLHPLKESNIPLELKWIDKPEYNGTLINGKVKKSLLKVKAVIAKHGVYMISMDSINMWQESGFLSDIFACFKRYGLSVDLIATSQSNVTITLDALANSLNDKILGNLLDCLSTFCQPKKIGPCAMISLVGKNIKSFFPELGSVLEAFKEQNCYLMTQSSSDLNFSFLVSENDAKRIIERLHSVCFGGAFDEEVLGETWQDLYDTPKKTQPRFPYERYWWYHKADKLTGLLKEKKPLYVYNLQIVRERLSSLKKLQKVTQINYALKANYNTDILSLLYQKGVCFDCVSFQEIEYLKKLFPDLRGDKIIFTPNFAPIDEYKKVLEIGGSITLDNLYLLENYGFLFSNKEVFIRLDPGSGKGHHPHVKTAGKNSKFGVSVDSLTHLISLAKKYKIKVIGLHAHVGSGILDPSSWGHTADFLAKIAKKFETIRYLNLGGGFGVPDNSLQKPIDFEALNQILLNFSTNNPSYELWIEPGRYLVAECGILLMNVTQIKKKQDKTFLGVNTGMNSLIRPSLYGSYHELVNLSHLHSKSFILADIVGPICETGDVLGHDRCIPIETQEDDVILLNNAGAYGKVMSSSYNMRAPATEFVF